MNIMNIFLSFSHERITNILDTMTEKLHKCRSRKFAIHFVGHWIDSNIKRGKKTQIKDAISKLLAEKFSQWQYVLVVYQPHKGGQKHWTNYDIQRFRHYGHNIVLHFLPPSNSKVRKDPAEPDKWCSHWGPLWGEHGDPKQCKDNNDDAHEWYNWIKNRPKDFGHISALTVLRGNNLALSGQNVCRKELSIETKQDQMPAVCHYCIPKSTVEYKILTIIYA